MRAIGSLAFAGASEPKARAKRTFSSSSLHGGGRADHEKDVARASSLRGRRCAVRGRGFLAMIEDSIITPRGCLILLAGIRVGKATVGKVELRLEVHATSLYIRNQDRLKLLHLGRALGLGMFRDTDALHGIPFRLLLSDIDFGGDASCIVAHTWGCEPASAPEALSRNGIG